MKSPKYRLPSSSFAILGKTRDFSGYFRDISRKQTPSMRQMLIILEPKTFPIDTPMFVGFNAEKTAMKSSGSDVEKATRMKPTVVFPSPVTLATLI